MSLHTPRPEQPCTQNWGRVRVRVRDRDRVRGRFLLSSRMVSSIASTCFDSGSEGWPGPHSHCAPNQPGRQWQAGSPSW